MHCIKKLFTCLDIQPPRIQCPSNVEVSVQEWGHNSTVIHYDRQKPQIVDNSGHVTYAIKGAPEDNVFPVGLTILTYEAFDDEGNVESCVRNIVVRGEKLNLTPRYQQWNKYFLNWDNRCILVVVVLEKTQSDPAAWEFQTTAIRWRRRKKDKELSINRFEKARLFHISIICILSFP